jgi:hypothetical protein
VPEALRPIPATERARPLNLVIVAVLLLAFVALLPSWRPVGRAGVPEGLLSHAPQGIAAELSKLYSRKNAPLRVWNPQLLGSWLEFAVPTGYVVSLDSRLELYPASIWADAEIIASASDGWRELLRDYRVSILVVAPEQTALLQALDARAGWVAIYRTDEGSIWTPPNLVLPN